jgi:hypothetical protein
MGYADKNFARRKKLMMDIFYQYKNNEIINFYKVLLNLKLDKLKKMYDFDNESQKGLIVHMVDFNIPEITFTKVPYNTYDKKRYLDFIHYATTLYKLYLNLKDLKTFDKLIQKSKKLKYSTLKILTYNIYKPNEDPNYFYDFKLDFDKIYTHYFELYIVSKLLKLKPNKEFIPLFEKCRKLLEDKKWY